MMKLNHHLFDWGNAKIYKKAEKKLFIVLFFGVIRQLIKKSRQEAALCYY